MIRILLCFAVLFVFLIPSFQSQGKSGSIEILEDKLEIPELKRKRTLRIYLPPDYDPNKEPGYPVLYMHDAQNLFDEKTAFAGEWQIDESLDALAKSHNFHLIVVGIDNGAEHRIHELSAWDHPKYGQGEGAIFTRFIVDTVKPFIDQQYNSNPQDTAIMGSSLGGLSTHYAIYQYPEVFKKAGIFSPSYWYSDEVFTFTAAKAPLKAHRLFFTVGANEVEDMHLPLAKMLKLLEAGGHPKNHLYQETYPQGSHNEAFWRSRVRDAIVWMYELQDQ